VVTCAPCEGENRFRIGAEFVQPSGFAGRVFKKLFGWLKAA